MKALRNIVENPLLRGTHARQRKALLRRFPVLSGCAHKYFLSLRKYLLRAPQRFFSEGTNALFSAWLTARDSTARFALRCYVNDHLYELNMAFLYLEEINAYDWHDHFEKLDDYELIRFIDQQIHPAYLRLVEGVLAPVLRIAAHFSRLDRNKKSTGLQIWQIADELARTDLSDAVLPYRQIVRNAIAHGGITYLQKEIRYQDNRGNEEKHADLEVIRLFDDLLDTCNALVLALSVFLFAHQSHGYALPQQLLLNELREETWTPWWEIIGCTPSKNSGLNQLIVYARPRTSDFGKVQFSTFQSGVLAEQFSPGYDRYFFSIRSKQSWPGWAGFDGKKLRQLRSKPDAVLEDYKSVLENDLVFYVPRLRIPKVLSRIHTLMLSVRLHWPLAMSDLRKQMGWADIVVRGAKIHRNAWGSVLNGRIHVKSDAGEVSQDLVRRSCRCIVRRTLAYARQRARLTESSRYLPLGFARVGVFRKDYRRRRLSSFGLGADLVCTIQVQHIRRIRCPDVIGATIEQRGKYRIAWNRAWLDDSGITEQQTDEEPTSPIDPPQPDPTKAQECM
jgi:hypothetical protein